ncbi:glucose-6-phosphate isomerase [Corticibacter populi]|uniref:Glucose-6-phosphate isomerase n=1 Tax=Corticibacter populi TaxID=1550736 RepID=A0A3M6QNF2_9BURK|nr:glucose-6-phosphate isomerase [Corticibacter populi]RMX04049.1 glucose-6-phosphate isomerase [Corticibacter populi]RZS33050.1 glucose-6-phosphate isomerase [Corticibacter populi]
MNHSPPPAAPATPRCDHTSAWLALQQHYAAVGQAFDLRHTLDTDTDRFAQMQIEAPYVRADLSRSLLDGPTGLLLNRLADETQLARAREALFGGAMLNTTEQRAAWHVQLRRPEGYRAASDYEAAALQAVHDTLNAFLAFAEQVRADRGITDVVNIGIGGSDLGPAVAVQALHAFAGGGPRLHFVSNIDGDDLGSLLTQLDPQSTLFLVSSKSFGTAETMTNARAARHWLLGGLASSINEQTAAASEADWLARHFVGLTTNIEAAHSFGIQTIFGFEEWVGGRFSLWSSIGLSIAIAIGAQNFRQLLAGAHAMDEHFRTAPWEDNLPVQLALLDIWYRNFHGFDSRCIAPYAHGLRRLTAYLQQLEMESNGKSVDKTGQPLPFKTAPIIWGEAGTNGQHAYFQHLHQGPMVIPVEFIVARKPGPLLPGQHKALQANALAQARALAFGKNDGPAWKQCPGNRPSSLLLIDALEPTSLGALIALYEHRIFVSGSLWGINSFDQWGVELGKTIAKDILARGESGDFDGLDAATVGAMQWLGLAASKD